MSTDAAKEPYSLELESLSGGYGRFDVLHEVSIRVARGEAVALLGPNGAGKSTVLRAIMNMLKHRRGHVAVGGVNVTRLPTYVIGRGHASLAPEGRCLFPGLSVEHNLRMGSRPTHSRERSAELLSEVFDLFPVVERHRRRPSTALSGGEQQMVAIGRAMMSDSTVMLLDEPSLGLAPLAIEDMARGLLALRERGRSLLLVEQRIDLALQVCDRVYVLSGGRIVQEGDSTRIDSDIINTYLG